MILLLMMIMMTQQMMIRSYWYLPNRSGTQDRRIKRGSFGDLLRILGSIPQNKPTEEKQSAGKSNATAGFSPSYKVKLLPDYGLIHHVLGSKDRQPRYGDVNDEGDGDIWLSEGALLVLRGGILAVPTQYMSDKPRWKWF